MYVYGYIRTYTHTHIYIYLTMLLSASGISWCSAFSKLSCLLNALSLLCPIPHWVSIPSLNSILHWVPSFTFRSKFPGSLRGFTLRSTMSQSLLMDCWGLCRPWLHPQYRLCYFHLEMFFLSWNGSLFFYCNLFLLVKLLCFIPCFMFNWNCFVQL